MSLRNTIGSADFETTDFAFPQDAVAGLCADAEYFAHLLNAHHIGILFCYAQCNNGALLYELFCCIKSIKKTFDEQRVLPSFSCNVEAVLRNEEIYKADLWYKDLSGDIE